MQAIELKGGQMAKIRRVNFEMLDGLRLDLQLNKQSFCRKAGICCFTYNRLDGAKKVKDDVIFKIANVLQVKPSELVYWEEDS